jgi:class 3 adenylate cyclase/predicted ATPase
MREAVDIAAWLRELGLERYEQAFRENDIASAVLRELTDQDLKDLGVSLGHRRLLLKAIRELADDQAGHGPAESAHAPETPQPALRLEAERRQLTVLFCDLVDSTELAGQLDPEDMGAVMGAYQHTTAKVVERFEGHVARYLGDGVLAYFGWPQAHEDDAERAVRAGLDLVDAVARLEPDAKTRLRTRIGIATGQVVVGDLVGEGAARDEGVVGETPNLAARLQALAAPGSVVISQATRRLVGGLFELADLGPQHFKGFAEPLRAFRVEGEGRAEGRFDALHGEHLTPLVGREHELGILLERWAWAKDGDSQVVLLSGEPGIGKSRLTRSLIERLIDEPHTCLRHYCSPYHTNSALYPAVEQFERAAGFLVEDSAETRLDKLEAVLAEATENLADVAPLIAALLSIPFGPRYPPVNLTPEVQKAKTFEALLGRVVGLAERRPLLMLFEDAHWIDPTSIELLGLMIDRIQRLPVLLMITFRPEFAPPWTGYAHVTSLTLSRLGQRQGAQMVERLTGGKPLPAEVLQQILLKTDGVPLFVEELTKTVLESSLLTAVGDHFELSGPLPPLAIPATLHDSLMARLDRLAPVKKVAQIGAVIGREFPYELLAAVARMSAIRLDDALEQLVNSELVFRCGTPPEATYTFKHALVQDTAYQGLLKSQRRELHARIAAVLEERLRDFTLTQPELLAHHYTEAQLTDRAIDYWRLAGNQASRRSANAEAVAHFRRGLRLLESVPDTSANREKILHFLVELGPALIAIRGAGTPEVEATYRNALDVAQRLPASELHFTASWGWWRIASDMRIALERADSLLKLATRTGDEELILQAHHCQWATHFHLGNQIDCLKHIDSGLQLYEPDRYRHHASIYGGHDPKVCGLGERALSLWLIGYPDRAIESAARAIRWARQIDHAGSILHAIDYALMLSRYRREPSRTLMLAGRMIKLSEQSASDEHALKGETFRSWATGILGNPTQALEQIRRSIAEQVALAISEDLPVFYEMMAEIEEALQLYQDGRASIEQGIKTAHESRGGHYWDAELLRRRAGFHDRSDATGKSETCLVEALAVARRQGAKSLELRAGTSLAQLWRDHGKRAEAHDLLAPVYGWFTEGFDTADLKDAKALLAELA